ncbi:DUF998 domain-containing protein [Dactylosporangium sp. CA-092794]|uniref:DUF998 domain-containing protein n=1 Tax=Dactylosporangium sp. CA-092794 TaxID=3239929 RepID=UPI003D8B61AF
MPINQNNGPRTLVAGAAGAALFILLFLVNDVVKPGYDPVRDAVSEAEIGRGGWLQITNFIVSGLLIAGSSVAVSRAVSRWTGRLVALVGAGLTLAGVFVSDPVPTNQNTWHGIIHDIVGTLSSAALIIACFTAARWRPTARWRGYCILVGVAMPVVLMIGVAAPETLGIWQRLTNLLGWTWLTTLELRAARSDKLARPGAGWSTSGNRPAGSRTS